MWRSIIIILAQVLIIIANIILRQVLRKIHLKSDKNTGFGHYVSTIIRIPMSGFFTLNLLIVFLLTNVFLISGISSF